MTQLWRWGTSRTVGSSRLCRAVNRLEWEREHLEARGRKGVLRHDDVPSRVIARLDLDTR